MENEIVIYRLYQHWEGSSSGGKRELGFFATVERAMSVGQRGATFIYLI